jgi:hypothetical protein
MADIRVLHGSPTDDEVAAVVVALTPVAAAGGLPAGAGSDDVPAWTRAALLEGIGGATVHAPDGLAAPGR